MKESTTRAFAAKWRALSVVGMFAPLWLHHAGCTNPYSSCESRRACTPEAGEDGGEAGAGGMSGGGNGGEGGGADAGGPTGSSGEGGEEPLAGSGGAAGATSPPECAPGDGKCGLAGSAERFTCEDGTWEANPCEDGEVCSAGSIECVPLAEGCAGRTPEEPFCDGAAVAVCNADLSEISIEPACEAGCEAGACIPIECGDGIVHPGEECDDGNEDPADGCTSCRWTPMDLVLRRATSCAIFGNGTAKCWGANGSGTLGIGDTKNRGDAAGQMGAALPFITFEGKALSFSSLDVGTSLNCGVSDGQLYCWGENLYGQLGNGTTSEVAVLRPIRVDVGGRVRSVSVGNHFGCAILENGDVKCWGRGYAGVLATGSTTNLGDQPGEMGSNLKPLSLGGPTATLQVGWQHVCALLTSGVMKCWGLGGAGQLGGRSSAFGDHATETAPPEVQLGPGLMVRELTLGQSHTCALTDAGLKCWGLNTSGQLGQDHANDLGKIAEEMGQALPLVPVSTPSDPVASVRAMNHATCASTRSGKLKCWGLAERGSLAQPSLTAAVGNIGDGQNEMSQLPPIDLGPDVSVRVFDVGATHGCVLLDTGEIKCWGNNDFGQLGLGHTNDIGVSGAELGTMLQPTRVQ